MEGAASQFVLFLVGWLREGGGKEKKLHAFDFGKCLTSLFERFGKAPGNKVLPQGVKTQEISTKYRFRAFFGNHYCGYISKFCGIYKPYSDP